MCEREPYRNSGLRSVGTRGGWELTLLWEWEAFPAEVTFELGHLVFCRAAARFCLVWNKHIYKRIVGHIQLDGLDWWIESNSPNDGFVRCLFSENSACHSPSVNCGKEAVTLSCHSGYWGGGKLWAGVGIFRTAYNPERLYFRAFKKRTQQPFLICAKRKLDNEKLIRPRIFLKLRHSDSYPP